VITVCPDSYIYGMLLYGAFTEESFDPVTSFSAEKKQDILSERIQIKT